jgi:hypothetical protein
VLPPGATISHRDAHHQGSKHRQPQRARSRMASVSLGIVRDKQNVWKCRPSPGRAEVVAQVGRPRRPQCDVCG